MTGPLTGDKAHPGIFDNAKIKQFVPGFHCLKPVSAGIRESAKWLREHPDQQRIDPDIDAIFEDVVAAWRRLGASQTAGLD